MTDVIAPGSCQVEEGGLVSIALDPIAKLVDELSQVIGHLMNARKKSTSPTMAPVKARPSKKRAAKKQAVKKGRQ